jgi:TonB-linked SusC/RagA family outer membrane protein
MNKTILYTLLICSAMLSAQSSIVTDSVNSEFIPYGVRTKKSLVASTSVVDGKNLSATSSPNLIQSLYGMLPGVLISQSSSDPGVENSELFIRGRSSLLENIPLILVDGVETSYQQISWSEVDKITVLKDASSLSIYGFRGANGVVLINTHRGAVTGKPVITLNARYGTQTPLVMPKFASAADYMTLHNEARLNDRLSPLYSTERINGTNNMLDAYLYPDINWRSEVLNTMAPVSDYSLTFKGGSNSVRYFLMLGYLNNQGFYKDTDPNRDKNSNINFDRYSFRSNVDISVSKEFTVSLDLSGRVFQKIQPNINIADHWRSMNLISFFPVQTPDGMWAGRQSEIANPKAAIIEGGFRSYHSRELNQTLRLHYDLSELIPGLAVFGTAAFNSWFKTNYDKTKQYPYYEVNLRPGTTPGTDDVAYDYVMRGTYSDPVISQGSYWQWNRFNLEGGFDYQRTFGDHALSGMFIYHQNTYRANGVHTPFAQQRYMARAHYGYKNTYFAEFTSSLSGSDNFEPGNRFVFFPAAGLAWVVTNEAFIKELEAIDFLKMKLSTGLTGSDRIGSTGRWGYQQYYNYGSGITIGGEATSGLSNLVEGRLSNPGLTWEKANITNFSIEAQLLKKLQVQADVFYEKRSDILVPAAGTRPAYIGISLPHVNEGSTENRGLEVALTYANKTGKFEHWIGGNISFIRSKVINKNEEPRVDEYRRETGHPVGTIFGLESIGFFLDSDDINNSPTQLFGANKPGDIKYRDLNGDNFIDELDMKAIGKSNTPELIYALNGGFKIAGFDLSFIIQGIGNRSVILSGNMVKPFIGNAHITPWAVEGRWTADNAGDATYPRLSTLDNSNNYQISTFWLRNGSYLRLKNLEIGYTLPEYLTKSIKIQQCRFYLNGNNLLTKQYISDISIDAESMTINAYPLLKTVNLGLNLTF